MRGPGRRFKKGQSGNPSGSTAFPVEVAKLRRLTAKEYALIVSDLLYADHQTLADIEAMPKESVLRRTVAGVLIEALEKKNIMALEMLLARVIGRVRDVSPLESDERSRNQSPLLEELRKVINDPKNERA